MRALISNVCGVLVTDDAANVSLQHAFPSDAEIVARIMLNLKIALPDERIDSIINEVCDYINNSSDEVVQVEDEFLHQRLEEKLPNRTILVKSTKAGDILRNDLGSYLAKFGDTFENIESFYEFNRAVNLELTKFQIKSVSESNDRLIIQAVNSIDDINKSTNIFSERIREWYGCHFPELTDQLVADHEFFLEIVSEIGTRADFSPEKLKGLRPVPDRVIYIMMQRAKESMGGDFSPYDIKTVQAFAKTVLGLYKDRIEIETYIESLMEQTCPNLTAIVGALLGARLICLAGGLEALAKKPSSTIQVLGAEKALFRAIKTKGEPPKHGILFQAKEVRNAPFWQRGKIARLLAGKISIAVRVDQVTKRYIADELLVDIRAKVAEIQRKYPDKPLQKKERSEERPQSFRQGTRKPQQGAGSGGRPPQRREGQGGGFRPSGPSGRSPQRREGQGGGFKPSGPSGRPPQRREGQGGGSGNRPAKRSEGPRGPRQKPAGKPAGKKYPPKGKPKSE
jgi:nucleolar protein 56